MCGYEILDMLGIKVCLWVDVYDVVSRYGQVTYFFSDEYYYVYFAISVLKIQ